MTYRYDQTSIYGITNPEPILYGDNWFYGSIIPTQKVSIPKNVYVLHERDYNIISWENSSDTDMFAYIVFKSKTYGHNDAEIIARINSKDVNGKTQTCYIDYLTDTELDTQYYYSIAAIDASGFSSFQSEWAADINQDISFSQYSYLYTDGMTQTYWNILDLYKQLGNFDTDRNVIPFRDIGVNYIQQKDNEGNTVNVQVKKDCNYLYATLLNLTDDQKNNYSNLEYTLFIDETKIASNKPNITSSVYSYENDNFELLKNLIVNKDVFISYFMNTNDYGEDTRIFNYISKIENPDNTLRVLNINRESFFNKILEVNNNELPLSNNGDPNIIFTYNGESWDLNLPATNTRINSINIKDYGITYSTYSEPVSGTTILISEYWELENADESEYKYINSIYDQEHNIIKLEDVNSNSYGISYKYNILKNNISFTVDYSKKVFVYFRVPYIYNSKILQTYIKETGVTGNVLNKINFKTYNYLIFPSTLGKIFNQQDIKLRQMKGNLYKTDAADDAIYRNFGSYFDFLQPAWMQKEENYRNCVLGSETIPGLLTAGMNGGTLKGIQQVINSYSLGLAEFSDQTSTKYLTVYNSTEYIGSQENLPIVLVYNPLSSLNQNSIICITNNVADIINNYTFEIESVTPSDSDIRLIGNGNQTENQINIEEGYTPLSGSLQEVSYILTDCELTDIIDIDPNIESNYYMYVTNDITTNPPVEITISDDINGPENPSLDDYWFNINSTQSTSYEFKTMYKFNGTSWEEYTSDLICSFDSNNYYYIADTTNTVDSGLYQLIEIDEKYFINVNEYFKNKQYSTDNSNDSRKSIMQLVGNNWVTVGYDIPEDNKEDWIFKLNYNEPSLTDPISYTHNYIINTWNIKYTEWVKNVPFTKYVVYGNNVKVNDDYIIDNGNFIVKDYLSNEEFVRNIDYTVKNNYITWINFDRKPKDGSFILISYDVDTRPETIRLINLIKYPQIHINYIWE